MNGILTELRPNFFGITRIFYHPSNSIVNSTINSADNSVCLIQMSYGCLVKLRLSLYLKYRLIKENITKKLLSYLYLVHSDILEEVDVSMTWKKPQA